MTALSKRKENVAEGGFERGEIGSGFLSAFLKG
jgi:hypothetical protein